jgi:hypothetical protein
MKVHMHDTVKEHKQRTFEWFWGKYKGFALVLLGIAFAFSTSPTVRSLAGIIIFIGIGIFVANWIDQKIHKKHYKYG